MSTSVERADNADVSQMLTLAQAKEQYILNYCAAAAAVLLLYDYVVTLGQESRYIWTDVRAGYAAIFLTNRLNMLCIAIYLILSVCPLHTLTVALLGEVIAISTSLGWACASTLRVYAISNRSILLAAITAALAIVQIPLNVFLNVKTSYFMVTFGPASSTCEGAYNYSKQMGYEFRQLMLEDNVMVLLIAVVILSRASIIASDLMVLVVTWWQLRGAFRLPGERRNGSAITALLLRDGTSYFVLFLLINIAQIIAQVMLTRSFNPIPGFMLPMTCIVISRLILNLRRLSFAMRSPMHRRSDTTSPPISTVPDSFHTSLLSTIIFRSNTLNQGSSNGGQMPLAAPESSRSPESALENGRIAARDHVMDDIVEDEGEQEDTDAE